MFALEAIEKRMSVRKFIKKDVSDDLIFEILEYASRSPSFKNSQPWEVCVVKGEKLLELSNLLIKEFESGNPPRRTINEPDWPSIIKDRMDAHINARARVFGVDPEDKEAMRKTKIENLRFYGATSAIFVFCYNTLSEWSIFDIGAFVYGITLSATAKGLGTVIQASLVDYPDIVKKFLNIPDDRRLIVGLSLGYPDLEDVANSYKSKRIPPSEFARIIK